MKSGDRSVGPSWSCTARQRVARLEDELLAFLRGKLARYKVPKSVRILTELPLSPAGKILKRSLSQT
jgi:acyl-CoA synthetase (AMP-forming)/AMP-acid ligase II